MRTALIVIHMLNDFMNGALGNPAPHGHRWPTISRVNNVVGQNT